MIQGRRRNYKEETIRSWRLSYLMVFVVPVLFFIVFLAISVSLINRETANSNRMGMEFIRHELDEVFNEFNNSSQELFINSDIQNIRSSQTLDEISSYELYTTITSVSRILSTKSSLSGLIVYAPDLDLYVSDVHYGRLSNMGLFSEYTFPYSQDTINKIFRTNNNSLSIYDASYELPNGVRVPRILITRPLSFVSQGTRVYVAAVAEVHFSMMGGEGIRNIMVFSTYGDRNLLYDFSSRFESLNLDELDDGNLFNEIFIQTPSNEVSLTYVLSFNWFDYYKPIILLGIFSIIYFVLTIWAGFYLTTHMVKKDWEELEKAALQSGLDIEMEKGGRYSPFVSSITKLEGTVEAQSKSLKSNILEKLILSQDESELISEAALEECGIHFLSNYFIVAITASLSDEADELIIKNLESDEIKLYRFNSKFGHAFILSLRSNDESNTYKSIATVFRELLTEHADIIKDAAASNIVEGMAALGDGYLEAINTMEYKRLHQITEFVFYRDIIELSGHIKFDYPSEASYAITDAIMASRSDLAIAKMHEVVNENREKGVSPRHMRYLLFSIASTILHTYSRLETRYGAVINPIVIPQILQSRNMDSSIKRLEECIISLSESARNAKESYSEISGDENYLVYQKVIAIVASRYQDVLLNVSDIAENLNISIAQLSKVFKKHHSMNLSDYISLFRISEAKKLLVKGDKPLAEIAEECGFGSLRTFMRVFKKYEGISPGQFRERSKE